MIFCYRLFSVRNWHHSVLQTYCNAPFLLVFELVTTVKRVFIVCNRSVNQEPSKTHLPKGRFIMEVGKRERKGSVSPKRGRGNLLEQVAARWDVAPGIKEGGVFGRNKRISEGKAESSFE